MWRNTQVWLKGPVLKTGRSATARGFESLFLRQFICCLLISRDGAAWQLAGLITQRSLVQIHLPQPKWSRGVAVITSACHAEDREFDSRRDRHFLFGFIAQSVEQRTENPCVAGSIPAEATIVFYCMRPQLNWIERQTTDLKVRGSTPLGRTIIFCFLFILKQVFLIPLFCIKNYRLKTI